MLKEKFLIIDGSSLVHRAFYALPILTNREGVFTNAVYGFTNMILKVIEQEQPQYIAVAFDKGRKTFRNRTYSEYKGHRKATPPELKPQFPLVQKLLAALNIAYYELEDYEADDIIGTFTTIADRKGLSNIVVTGDRDILQLITENTKVLLTKKGISQTELMDKSAVKDKYGIDPLQIIDLKGLMGDQSDNIPGVPSVGEKTALKLLKQFGTIENIYENIDQVSGKKLKENLEENKEQAFMSKELATIECCVPMEFDLEECLYKKPDYNKLLELLRELEFNSLVKKFLDEMEPEDAAADNDVKKLGLTNFMDNCNISKHISLVIELSDDHVNPELIQGALVQGEAVTFFDSSREEELLNLIKNNPNIRIISHDYKEIHKYFLNNNIVIDEVEDTQIAAYLLDPTRSGYGLEELALEYLNIAVTEGEDTEANYIEKAVVLEKLFYNLEDKLKELNLYDLYKNVEMPLVSILSNMEKTGVKVVEEVLDEMAVKLEESISVLTKEIYEMAGEEFNINSPKQLGVILFEKMDLPIIKKTKTGYSTNAEVLEQLAIKYPIAEKILEYRHFTKLKGTYVDGLKALINKKTGKIHTTFKQTITATGRLSSVEPNLQNIPIRLEEGRAIRKAFVPSKEENYIIAADYSQIELRVLAHLSEDENLLDAFAEGHDIHTRTASQVFGVAMEDVTSEMRRNAKAVNFGIIYGISDFGLAKDLGISRKEAKTYIEQYFKRYKGVNEYIQNTINKAREQGYVTTLLNRRRYLPDLFSPNKNIRAFGERTAMNTPIQGSAADIIKLAMIKCSETLADEKLPVNMLLQVHDELIFESPRKVYKEAVEVIRASMENAFKLKVPLVVDVKYGVNWYELKEI